MKKIIVLLIGLTFFACGGKESINEIQPQTDIIIGRWEETLDQASIYDEITWIFTAEGEMQLDFDDDFTAYGEWTNLNSPANTYSFSFQQYPDAAKRTFFLALRFTGNNTAVNIYDDGSTFHWVSNRSLNKIED
jgi:hypothetical protein